MNQLAHYIIVDDDPTSNLICEYTIQRFDKEATITVFTQPHEALQYLEEEGHKQKVLFLDVNMPEMSGFEFLREFEKLPLTIKEKYRIFMLTSSIEDYSGQEGISPMVQGIFSKPMKISYLEQIEI